MPVTAIDSDGSNTFPSVFVPPREPLPLWRFVPTFIRNPLRAIPVSVYTEPMVAPLHLKGRFAWITAPPLVEQVLLKEAEKFRKSDPEDRVFGPIIGGGILTAHGQEWRWQRRTLAPLFRHAGLLELMPAMREATEARIASWQRAGDGLRAIDQDMTDLTFDVLTSTIFAGTTTAEREVLKHGIGHYLESSTWEIAYEILRWRRGLWHPRRRRLELAAAQLRSATEALVEREAANGWRSGGLAAQLGRARDPDSGEAMSHAVIAANLGTFAAAGHETTAKALTWALFLLARRPEWQARIRAEAESVAGRGPIEAQHIDALEITRQVFEEAMRLYPPAPVLTRQAVEPVTIGTHHFEAGATIIVPIFAIHRHRKLWSAPDRFDPARFEKARAQSYLRTQYMPFGFGPRICIGMTFAMIEGTLLLAMLVRAMEFSTRRDHLPEPLSRVTLRPRGGMRLQVVMRK